MRCIGFRIKFTSYNVLKQFTTSYSLSDENDARKIARHRRQMEKTNEATAPNMERDEHKQKHGSGKKLIWNFFHLDKVQRRRQNKRNKQEKSNGISWQDKRLKNELFEKVYLQIEYKIVEVFFLYAVMKSHNVWMLQFSAYSRFSLQLLEIFVLVASKRCNFVDQRRRWRWWW